MCFEFGSWFGNGRREDYGGEPSARKAPPGHGRRVNRRSEAYYGGATDHKAPPAATYTHQPPTAVDEAGQKAYHDGAWKDQHGGYTSYVQEKQADKETPKLPAWHNQIGGDAGYAYTTNLHETPAGHRQNAAMYPTTTVNTTTLVSRSTTF